MMLKVAHQAVAYNALEEAAHDDDEPVHFGSNVSRLSECEPWVRGRAGNWSQFIFIAASRAGLGQEKVTQYQPCSLVDAPLILPFRERWVSLLS